MGTTAEWVSVSIGLPDQINDAVDTVEQILDTVSTILEVINGILEIIKVFLLDIESPLVSLVEALLAIVEQLIEDFSHSGLYMYIDGPKTPGEDPSLKYYGHNLLGGMDAWRSRMAHAFYNASDPNRPQFSNSASVISFHLVVTSGSLGDLLSQLGFLINLLGDRMLPNMEPPRAVKARAVNPEFINAFYDTNTGMFSDDKLTAYKERIKTEGAVVTTDLGGIVGTQTFEVTEVDPVLRYDLITGEELVIDKKSGAVLASQKGPTAVLLTWKADQNLLPNGFQIERSTTKGGQVTVTDRKNTAGDVIASNLLVPDEAGRPLRTYETIITPTTDTISASIAGQYGYLDNTVEATGLSYYYRIRSKVRETPTTLDVPDMDLTIPIIRGINSFLLMLQDVLNGLGDPSEEVSVFIPSSDDLEPLYNLHMNSMEATGKPAAMVFAGNGGWSRVGLTGIAKPILMVIEELRNFVQALLDSIRSGVAEIVAFIELMQTKINTLNTFIEILQAIIAMIEAISLVEFGCLFVTTDNGTAGGLQAINDNALPGVPTATDSDYVASVTILGGTAGVGAALNALQVLFGIS